MADVGTDENQAQRQALLTTAERVVVKVGSTLLHTSPAGRPAAIADQIISQPDQREFLVVSSGAVALGFASLGLEHRPTDLPSLQAAAAVGQNRLMSHWHHAFAAHRREIAQVLLTHDDLANRRRFLNARHALRALLTAGLVPVINENDTVAVDELKYGDNDRLAALVCNLCSADVLLLLTDVDGLLNALPSAGGERIPLVSDIDSEASPYAGASSDGGIGSGGMNSKVEAARAAGRFGVATLVLDGSAPDAITRALAGEDVGTLFVPSGARLASRKHWIAYGAHPSGKVVVDDGARAAVCDRGTSLLAAGVVEVVGEFALGDIVSLVTAAGTEFARGLAGYPAEDLRKVAGLRSADIEATLGYKYLDEVIHRDDLALV